MKHFVYALILFLGLTCRAQNVIPSNTYVRTCLNDVECASINSSSYLFYDESKQKFYLKIDFNRLKTGQDSVDFWLEDLNDTYLYFKASLPRDQFPTLSTYNTKNFTMDGQVFLNNVWRNQTIDISIYRAESDLLSNNTNASELAAYKVNFSFSFSPKDFNIHKKPQRLTNTIFVGVGAGEINPLRAGMENQVGEAYNRE
jgi:hypothetical protein